MSTSPFFYIAGATATGKSRAAVEIAEALGGVVVGCDAPQLYRDLPILTAQPEPELLARVEHRLVGILPPEVEISAGEYARRASAVLAELWERRVPAIVCGGSGLYLRALTHGLDDFPPTPPEVRERYATLPPSEALAQLLQHEPEAARWIALDNPRRVQRALELLEITGRPLADLRRSQAGAEENALPSGIAGVALTRDRAELHARIAQRTRLMLEGGALEEVAAVRDRPRSTTFSRVIGLRECVEYLEGVTTLDACAEQITRATRQYAKRQETWFRKHAAVSVDAASGLAHGRLLADAWYVTHYSGQK